MSRVVEGTTGDLLEALGAVVLNFSGVEETFRDAIMVFAHHEGDSDGRVVNVLTARLSFPALVDKFGALCKDLGTASGTLDEAKTFCVDLGQLNHERNTMIHSNWNVPADGSPKRFKRSATPKSGFWLNVTEVEVETVWEFATKLSDAQKKVWEIVP